MLFRSGGEGAGRGGEVVDEGGLEGIGRVLLRRWRWLVTDDGEVTKGWPVAGLGPAASAAQEAWEEAGVEGTIDDTRLGRFNYDKIMPGQTSFLCAVEVFALRVAKLRANFPERAQRRRKWFDAGKAARKVAEPQLRQLLQHLPEMLQPRNAA